MRTERICKFIVLGCLAVFLGACSASSADDGSEPVPAGLLELETFLTNIADPSGERYCKLSLKLGVVPQEKVAEIEADPLLQARVRDQILTLLAAKTFHDLSDPAGKETLRQEIRTVVSEILADGEVREEDESIDHEPRSTGDLAKMTGGLPTLGYRVSEMEFVYPRSHRRSEKSQSSFRRQLALPLDHRNGVLRRYPTRAQALRGQLPSLSEGTSLPTLPSSLSDFLRRGETTMFRQLPEQ